MNFLLRHKRIFLGFLVLVSLFLAYSIKDVGVDFSFDSFYPKQEPEYIFYKKFKTIFPQEDNGIHIAVRKGEGEDIFDLDFLRKVDTLFTKIGVYPHIDTLISPTRLEHYQRSGMGVSAKPLINLEADADMGKNKARIQKDSMLYYNFFSTDYEYIAGVVLAESWILDGAYRDTLCINIREELKKSGLDYVVSGVPMIRTQYVETITRTIFLFLILGGLLIVTVLFLIYRKWWGILFPLIGVMLALIWTLGLMAVMGKKLDLMIELLIPIMFVVGMADIIHMITKYVQELKKGTPKEEAMEITLKDIGSAIFLTSVTTAIGFGSLIISKMPPVKDFGLYAAIGVLFAWIISIILIPNVLLALDEKVVRDSKGVGNAEYWDRWLLRLNGWVSKNTRAVLGIFTVLLVLAGVGISMISTDSYLLDDISPSDPARKGMMFFEEEFYGLRPFEMSVQAKGDKKVTDLDILLDMEKIEEYLRQHTHISPFFSPVNYLKGANQLYKNGATRHFVLPDKQEKVDELFAFGITSGASEIIGQMMTKDKKQARISAQIGDIGTDRSQVLREDLDKFVKENCNLDNFEYRLTGTAILTEMNVTFLRASLFQGLLLAFGLVGLILGFLFRSWKMVIIGIIPNIIPLLVTAGIMGFAGITLRASTSITFLIAFGIAVDDTIHFLSRLRLELNSGATLDVAIRNTMLGTGKALVLTTLILLGGFAVLLFSDFGGSYAVGVFTGVTLITALFSDLLLLPVLVRMIGLKGTEEPNSTEKIENHG